jgi:hypothetical protein
MVEKYPMKVMYNNCNFRACHCCVVNILVGGPPNGSVPPVEIFVLGFPFKMPFRTIETNTALQALKIEIFWCRNE